jgi:uncharacterized delta-60 repeat protein
MALQADGKFVVAGYAGIYPNSDFKLERYKLNGTLDTSFGTGGIVTTDFGGDDYGNCVAVQADGKIIAAGKTYNGSNDDFALARYKSDGTLDTTFGTGGKVTNAISTTDDSARGMALQADGKIVVTELTYPGITLVRYCVALPDTRIGPNAAVMLGDNTYNLTGAGQALTTAIRHGGGVKTSFISIQNDGPATDSFKVYGMPGNAKFAVKYLYGGANVTYAVTHGIFNTGPLARGAACLLAVKVTAKTPLPRQIRNLYIFSTSAADSTAMDCVLIKAKSN